MGQAQHLPWVSHLHRLPRADGLLRQVDLRPARQVGNCLPDPRPHRQRQTGRHLWRHIPPLPCINCENKGFVQALHAGQCCAKPGPKRWLAAGTDDPAPGQIRMPLSPAFSPLCAKGGYGHDGPSGTATGDGLMRPAKPSCGHPTYGANEWYRWVGLHAIKLLNARGKVETAVMLISGRPSRAKKATAPTIPGYTNKACLRWYWHHLVTARTFATLIASQNLLHLCSAQSRRLRRKSQHTALHRMPPHWSRGATVAEAIGGAPGGASALSCQAPGCQLTIGCPSWRRHPRCLPECSPRNTLPSATLRPTTGPMDQLVHASSGMRPSLLRSQPLLCPPPPDPARVLAEA